MLRGMRPFIAYSHVVLPTPLSPTTATFVIQMVACGGTARTPRTESCLRPPNVFETAGWNMTFACIFCTCSLFRPAVAAAPFQYIHPCRDRASCTNFARTRCHGDCCRSVGRDPLRQCNQVFIMLATHMPNMLASVLKRLDECADSSKRVYAIEQPNCSRNYVIETPDNVWNQIKNSKISHFYEVLTEPCNLYLDIEWITPLLCKQEKQLGCVNHIVDHVCKELLREYAVTDPDVIKACASGQTAKGFKNSWHVHVHCPNICWQNSAAVGQFVRRVCHDFHEVDKLPYAHSGQNWRCVGSSKVSEPSRRFEPVNQRTFWGCTVQHPVGNRAVISPDVPVPSAVPSAPSWVHRLADVIEAGAVPQMCCDSRCVVPLKKRSYCEHAKRVHRSNHQYAVINVNTLMWKLCCHACADAISCWRVFPYDVLLTAFACQSATHRSTAPAPGKKQDTAAAASDALVDLRCHGPPPYRNGNSVQCCDGVYIFAK